jgi:dipeptidase E
MKLLLTSNGLSNKSIANALEELVGKPRKEIKIAFVPNAAFPQDDDQHESRDWLVDDLYRIKGFCGFIDVISLADLSKHKILERLEYVDVIFVGGGNTFYLSYWMQKSGLFDTLPDLLKTRVYAGISAGSIIAGVQIVPSSALDNVEEFHNDDYYEKAVKDEGSAKPLNLVNLVFRSHLNSEAFPRIRKEILEQIIDKLPAPLYALDDDSALKIIDDKIEVITEGEWLKLDPEGNT